ncbi:MAG TPA: GIY-YIG nuclease family protein [Candidatus Paceibacterota bacterium]
MYWVYAIRSLTRKYIYVGLTGNLTRRFGQHNAGESKTTRKYRPFELLYTEKCQNRPRARERERYLKSGTGKEFLKTL